MTHGRHERADSPPLLPRRPLFATLAALSLAALVTLAQLGGSSPSPARLDPLGPVVFREASVLPAGKRPADVPKDEPKGKPTTTTAVTTTTAATTTTTAAPARATSAPTTVTTSASTVAAVDAGGCG